MSAAWPSEDAIRVSDRLRRVGHDLEHVRKLKADVDSVSKTRTWRAGLRFAIQHPTLGAAILKSVGVKKASASIEHFMVQPSLRTLAAVLLKHPWIGFRYVLPNVSIRWGSSERSSEDDKRAPALEPDDEGESDDILEILDSAEELVLSQQAVSVAERESDRRLFGGRDRDSDGFVRLFLRQSYHDFQVPGTATFQKVVFEPRLLLHESGVIQLTVAISATGPLDRDQVVRLMWGGEPVITRSEIPLPLLRGSGFERAVTSWTEKPDALQPVAVIQHEQPESMTGMILSLLGAVGHSTRSELEDWSSYPTAILDVGKCCSNWSENHETDVAQVLARIVGDVELSSRVISGPDFSATSDHSLFANMATTAYLRRKGRVPKGIPELETTLMVEYALLLFGRLQALEREVSEMRTGQRRLRLRYRRAVQLFSELRQGDVRAGGAREFIRHLLRDLGGDEVRPTIETGLNLSGLDYSTASAARASRRSWWLALLGTVIAAVVAIPPVGDLLTSVRASPSDTVWEFVLAPLRAAASLGEGGPWAVIAALLAAVVVTRAVAWMARQRLPRLNSQSRGYAWPTLIDVEVVDTDDPHGADGEPSK